MTKQVQQAIIPTHVLGSTGTADTSDLGYRALGSFKSDLGLGTSLTSVNVALPLSSGTDALPGLTFNGDLNTGIFRPAADELGFVTNGSEKVRITSAGNVGIGTSSPTSPLTIKASGASIVNLLHTDNTQVVRFDTFGTTGTDAGPLFRMDDQTGVTRIQLDSRQVARSSYINTPSVGIGTSSPATQFHVNGTIRYTNRPAAGTITAIGFDTNGDLKASSSSLRYKHDIEDYDKGLAEVMQLRSVSFKFNGEENTNIGFIAEEVDALGLTEVMLYNEEEQPEGVIYANMVSLLTKAIQEQQSIINELKVRIETLESNV